MTLESDPLIPLHVLKLCWGDHTPTPQKCLEASGLRILHQTLACHSAVMLDMCRHMVPVRHLCLYDGMLHKSTSACTIACCAVHKSDSHGLDTMTCMMWRSLVGMNGVLKQYPTSSMALEKEP